MLEWQTDLAAYQLAGLITPSLSPASSHTPRLALHGWLDNAASMAGLLIALNEMHPAPSLALDFPGHGLSSHTEPHHHAPFVDYLDAVLAALETQNWPQVDLIGHSMGGGVATLFAAAFPEKVRRLLLLDSIGPLSAAPNTFSHDLRRGLLARRAPKKSIPSYPDQQSALAARTGAIGITELQAAPIVERGIVHMSDGLWRWRSDARLTQPSPTRFSEAQVLNAISEIRAPALVILAEPRASFFEASTVDARLAAFANAEIVNVQGNHHLHVCPDAGLVARVAGFLET
jgi:pimeloyl-ACP methyl ester carboxylesterase